MMKLGAFDEERAKAEAHAFLSKSISVLSSVLGVDIDSFDETAQNPHDQSSPFFNAFNVLSAEVKALKKLGVRDE